MTHTTKSAKETAVLAADIASKLRGGETLALIGELGSGKTTFVKALAKALGVRKPLRSPTFVLMVPYRTDRGTKKRRNEETSGTDTIRWLVHIDAYRVNNARDLEAIGIRDYLGQPDTVTIIEWADRVKHLLPKNSKTLSFSHGKTQNERRIVVR